VDAVVRGPVVAAVSLTLAATGSGCRHTVDFTGSPRPFLPQDTLVTRAATVSAAGAHGVQLTVADGAAYVTTGQDDSVRASLVVGPQGRGRNQRERCPTALGGNARLVADRSGGLVTLRAEPSLRGRCAVAWRISVPRRITLNAYGEVADFDIDGVTGGVTLSTRVGRVVVKAPSGSVDATIRDVGNIIVESGSSDYGEAAVRSDVGSVELRVDGHRVDAAQAPGAGERIGLRGQGRDRFRIETGVGRATLSIDRRRGSGSE
jgi:hypothetical protein